MKTMRNALLGACLALPLAALSAQAQPRDSRVITVPPGATVLILPAPGAAPAAATQAAALPADAAPMLRLIAEQQAMMQRMFANFDAMFPPMPAFGTPLTVALPAGGHGVCSQSISIVDRGDGSAPIVKTAQSGDACGAMGIHAPQAVSQPEPAQPIAPPHGPRVLEVGYPPQPLHGLPPRT